ncbi:hypothetical protein RU639_012489 [Aspergillus parasiticus]
MMYDYSINTFPTYYDSVPTAAVNGILEYNDAFSGCSLNVSRANNRISSSTAINPAWHEAAVSAVIGVPCNYTDRQDLREIFYGRTAVGSERWVEREDDLLCRAV